MACGCEGKTERLQPPEDLLASLRTDTTYIGWIRLSSERQVLVALCLDEQGEPKIGDLKIMTAEEAATMLGSVKLDDPEDIRVSVQYDIYRPRPEISQEQYERMKAIMRKCAAALK